jgi:hypothetical protein
MTDLIYIDREHHAEVQEMIRAGFPAATFEDASDFIHEGRFQVTLEGVKDRGEYYRHLIRIGVAGSSLGANLWFGALTPEQRERVIAECVPAEAA